MKKLLFLLSVILLTSSCLGDAEIKDVQRRTVYVDKDYALYIVVVDSCEYILYDGTFGNGITHKENCKYCIERNKKQSR